MNSLGFFIVLYFLEMTSMTFVQGSAVTSRLLRGRRFFFKRDDLMTSSSGLSGNKARKFMHLEQNKLPPSIVSLPEQLVLRTGTTAEEVAARDEEAHAAVADLFGSP